MQLLTNELREYNMQLLTTKCLNTAVMMMYLMLGAHALKITRFCDVDNVRKRHASGTDPRSLSTAARLAQDIELTRERNLFYIMITDGDMKSAKRNRTGKPDNRTRYFPGHVFVIESLPRGTFNMYQSYINHYDLSTHIDQTGSLSLGRERMRQLLDGLVRMMMTRVWSRETSEFWVQLTNTPLKHAQQFEGFQMRDTLLLCYRKVTTKTCLSKLRDLVDVKLHDLKQVSGAVLNQVYGCPDRYSSTDLVPKPLTNMQMLADLRRLRAKL